MDKLGRERKDWFYSYNMIFKQQISEHAKLVYLFLCRCADGDGQSFPSHKTIGEMCSIKSRQTVIDAIRDLEKIGLLVKIRRIGESGGKRSNLYVVNDNPCPADGHTHVQQMDNPCPADGHTHVQQMDNPCPADGHEVLLSKGLSIEVLPSEGGENTPAHSSSTYGEYGRVHLAANEYDKLVDKYGEAKTHEYINQLDRRIASEGKQYKNHCATLEVWIQRENKLVPLPSTKKKPRYNNFQSRNRDERDYAELERLERQKLQADLKEIRPADVVASDQTSKTNQS